MDSTTTVPTQPAPNGQTLWLYLLTGPRTRIIPGVITGREAVMADDLRWPVAGFREAFAEASGKGMAKADWDAGLVYLPKALMDSDGDPRDSQRPESPNVVKSWAREWFELPECDLRTLILQDVKSFCETLGESYLEAFNEAFAKALRKAGVTLPVIRTQDSGLRDPDPLPPARDPSVPEAGAVAPDLGLAAMVEHAKRTLDAARQRIDPSARRVPAFGGQPESDLLSRLRETPADERCHALDHAIAVLIAEAETAGSVADLRLAMLAGTRAWPRLQAMTVRDARARSTRGRDGPGGFGAKHAPAAEPRRLKTLG